jgi:hypothetical protein
VSFEPVIWRFLLGAFEPVIWRFLLGACEPKHIFSLQGERALILLKIFGATLENSVTWAFWWGLCTPALTTLKVSAVVIVINNSTLQYLAV